MAFQAEHLVPRHARKRRVRRRQVPRKLPVEVEPQVIIETLDPVGVEALADVIDPGRVVTPTEGDVAGRAPGVGGHVHAVVGERLLHIDLRIGIGPLEQAVDVVVVRRLLPDRRQHPRPAVQHPGTDLDVGAHTGEIEEGLDRTEAVRGAARLARGCRQSQPSARERHVRVGERADPGHRIPQAAVPAMGAARMGEVIAQAGDQTPPVGSPA